MTYDAVVIGGGLVGSAIAHGLAAQLGKVLVLDGEDRALRASRGNFGLVWVQGKGEKYPPYAHWTQTAANLWPAFDEQLSAMTSVSPGYRRTGGFAFCLDEGEWQQRVQSMEIIKQHTKGQFEYEMLSGDAVRKQIPKLAETVVGASFCPSDGHVDPLALLHALHRSLSIQNVHYQANQKVSNIESSGGEFVVHTNNGRWTAGKLVLCAGLFNEPLGKMVGLDIPSRAERGQVLITERVEPFLAWPTLQVRQTTAGTVQIGDSHENTGFDDGTDPLVLKKIAARAVSMFPCLAQVRLVRAWGALRILSPDGNPIYQQSSECPGAYAVTCHSGVTLAAAHAGPVADWLCGKRTDSLIDSFSTDRFNV